jgi:hypothetical protein
MLPHRLTRLCRESRPASNDHGTEVGRWEWDQTSLVGARHGEAFTFGLAAGSAVAKVCNARPEAILL